MGDEPPDPRTVHGHTVAPRRADEENEVLHFTVDRFSVTAERIEEFLDGYETDGHVVGSSYTASITFNIDLFDGTVTAEELADIVEAMKEMEDEYFGEDNGEDYVGYKSGYGNVRRIRNDADVEIGNRGGMNVVFFDKEDLHPDDYTLQKTTTVVNYDGEKDHYWYFRKVVDPSEYDESDFVTEHVIDF